MNSKYITEKNRINNRIRELIRYNEIDNNTIERLKNSQINIEFNKKQIEKLCEKNEERKSLIEELKQREKDLEDATLFW